MEIKHLLLGLTATLSISPAWGSGSSYVYHGEELGDKFNVSRPIYQQSDANVDDVTTPDGIRQLYLRNRRVLTGGCIKIQFGTPSVFKLAENLILLKQ